MPVEVAVVGGGPLGLMALKNFCEDGFDATLYESRAWVGGLWKYSDDAGLSTAENTRFNSSKYRAAISDFPVPDDMDDFPTAPQLHKYFESYCDHFDLWPHIKLNSPVKSVKREAGRWALEVVLKDGSSHTDYYDKVALSCGPFIEPKQPKYDGLEKFQGQTLHAINFHHPSQFEGQNVMVVGAHASAQDIVAQLSKHASKVFLSHRSGIVMLPRYSSDGSVYDRQPPLGFTILTMYISTWFPSLFTWVMDKLVTMMAKKGFPNPPASLGTLATTKAPAITVAPPLIASELYPHFQSGFCEGVPEVSNIAGPKSILFKNGRTVHDIDAIVYCTGYHSLVPVEMEPTELNPYPYPGSTPNLYRYTFPLHPDPEIRNSLAFLGQVAVALPGFAQHEMVGMAISQIWRGKSSLPPLPAMQKWRRDVEGWREDQKRQYRPQSTFYTVFVPTADHLDWLDACAGIGIRTHFGLLSRWTNSRAWKLWSGDRKLYNLCLGGLTSPAIFRLFDEGKRKAWAGARAQIFVDNEQVERQRQDKQEELKKMKKEV